MRPLFLFLIIAWAIQPAISQAIRQSNDRALLFAVNDYQYMKDLNNPVQNAWAIAKELDDLYGFDTEVVTNPTFEKIEQKIIEYQQAYRRGSYDQDGQLFIFFSGHGVHRGKNGYFIPADGDPSRPYAKGMEYDFWRSEIDAIDCKHILVAIDACHSITFDPNWENKPDRLFKRPGEQYRDQTLLNHESYRARLFFTSDAEGNETPDRSTFARQLLEGLRTHQSSTAYLTSSELFASYLLKAAPTPGGGDFGRDEPGSCFLFFGNRSDVDSEEERFWKLAKQNNTSEAYAFYLQLYPNGEYKDPAAQAMQKLLESTKTVKPIKKQDELPSMVFVQSGTFTMGCQEGRDTDCFDSEKPAHEVTLSSFSISKYEVTQAQWRAVMGSAPPELNNSGCDQCPVERVSWDDIQEFLQKLNAETGQNYRLPTEAEWEYAARGGNKSEGYEYSGSNDVGEVAWYSENYKQGNTHGSEKTTRPVGGKKPNELGLYDMSGNVWEWCSDWYGENYYQNSPQQNPSGPELGTLRVLRGGGWNFTPRSCRAAYRGGNTPAGRDNAIGFRLARS